MSSQQKFWDQRWEEYKRLDPSLKDSDRPAHLMPSITPAEWKRMQDELKIEKMLASLWAL